MKEKGGYSKLLNIFLFALLTLTWGFTWFAGKILVTNETVLIPEILASYRFLFAGVVLFVIAKAFNLKITPSLYNIKVCVVASLFGCSINLFLFYYAALYLISGISSVIFSMVIILNIVIGVCFGVKQVNFLRVLLLALVGVFGLYLVVVSHTGFMGFFEKKNLVGILLAFLATLSFSVSTTYYQTRKNLVLHPVVSFAYMCIFGSIWCIFMGFVHSVFGGFELNFVPKLSFGFIVAFLYLALFGTAIGYLCFFVLVRRIGALKTSYSSLITPLFSMCVSLLYENYHLSFCTLIGLSLIIIVELFALMDKNIK